MTKPSGPCIRATEYSIRRIEPWQAAAFAAHNHYAAGSSNTAVYAFGLYAINDSKLLGISTWLPPTKVAAQSVAVDWQNVLSLSRFVLMDSLPKNAESFFLGRCIRVIRKDKLWRVLLTYADHSCGHSGIIYRAAGWKFVGYTQPEEKWVTAAGRQVSKKMGRKSLTRREMLACGYKSLGKFSKSKFILELRQC